MPSRKNEPKETDQMLDKGKVAMDKGNFVYSVILLNGLGVLLPWNMFITIAPQYYVEYWFKPNGTETEYSEQFMSAQGMAAQLPNLAMTCISVFLTISGPFLLRVLCPLVFNCAIVVAVWLLIFLVEPSLDAMGWFYVTTLILVAVLNASNGIYQNSIFGLSADFPLHYTNAIVLGNNLCGIFTTVLHMICTLVLEGQIRTIALIYFAISLIVLVLCGFSLLAASRNKFYKYHIKKGEIARMEQNTSSPSLAQYLECFRGCWVQLYNVFITFFITLTIFPAMLVNIESNSPAEEWNSFIPKTLWITLTTFLNFNAFAALGSFLAGIKQFPSPRVLWVPVTLRALFIPFFMMCNYLPSTRGFPVLIANDVLFICGGAAMSLSHGYLSSLGMMYAPRVVHSSLSMIAGKASAFCLVLGLFSGVSFTFVIASLTKA